MFLFSEEHKKIVIFQTNQPFRTWRNRGDVSNQSWPCIKRLFAFIVSRNICFESCHVFQIRGEAVQEDRAAVQAVPGAAVGAEPLRFRAARAQVRPGQSLLQQEQTFALRLAEPMWNTEPSFVPLLWWQFLAAVLTFSHSHLFAKMYRIPVSCCQKLT
jgi:hypothetical protein